jgi:HPt (histidine-containing phosphotransfer) domain-containing protein
MEKLEQTFKQANWEQLAITAHGLKGSGGTFGYPEITEIAGRLEQAAFSADGVTAEATISELRMRVTEIVDSAEEAPPITKADNDTGRDKPVL